MTSRFTMAVHMLGLAALRQAEGRVTSEEMARSINTNPVVVRRLLGHLCRAGLLEVRRGAGGGVWLSRPPESITLRDVYEAVEAGEVLVAMHPRVPSTSCVIGRHITAYLEGVFGEAEEAFKQALARQTVADLRTEVARRAGVPRRSGGTHLA